MSKELNKALDLLREIRPSIPKDVLELWCKDRDAFLAQRSEFHQHLKECADEVATWPTYKQEALGPFLGHELGIEGETETANELNKAPVEQAGGDRWDALQSIMEWTAAENIPDDRKLCLIRNAARAALAHAPTSSASPSCKWTESSGIWETGCGQTWSFIEDGPAENGALFCHHCGGRLVLIKSDDQEDDGEPCPDCMENAPASGCEA